MGFHFSVQLTGDMFSNLTTGHRAASVAANRPLITIIILFYEEGEHTLYSSYFTTLKHLSFVLLHLRKGTESKPFNTKHANQHNCKIPLLF